MSSLPRTRILFIYFFFSPYIGCKPLRLTACLVVRCNLAKSILRGENRLYFWSILFGCLSPKSILIFRINFKRSENFLLYIKIAFRKTTKHKSLYLKINYTKIESNTHLVVSWFTYFPVWMITSNILYRPLTLLTKVLYTHKWKKSKNQNQMKWEEPKNPPP